MSSMAKVKKTTLHVDGMHCPSCEILINDKFREAENVREVKPNFKNQKVEVLYTGNLNKDFLNRQIIPFGYQITEETETTEEPWTKRLFEAVAIGSIVVLLYLMAQELNLVPTLNFTGTLSFMAIFAIGLVASVSTCMATSGALFLSISSRGKKGDMGTALFFNAGRIASYGTFGFLAGLIGQALVTNLKFGSFLTLLAAVFMVLLGLDLAKILSIGRIIPSGLNKMIFEKLEHKLMSYPRKAPTLLGAITYFLPCGFTQAVQVYALGQASPMQSALTMMIFALGTTPALLLVGSLGSFTKSGLYNYFMKTMGVVVFIIGFLYFSNFLTLYGININPLNGGSFGSSKMASIENGVQIIEMTVNYNGYSPNSFTVRKGIPVKWKIQGLNVFGCQAYFIAPKLGIQKVFAAGENLIEFTPQEVGPINFSCGMGMYRGRINVI